MFLFYMRITNIMCHDTNFKKIGIPKGIRTPVAGMKTRCPRPLDERDRSRNYNHLKASFKYRLLNFLINSC